MKRFGAIGCVSVLTLVLVSTAAFAAPAEHLNWGYQLNASDTACPSGDKVLNVVRKIVNTLDSGTGTNDYGAVWWADSEYVQHIRIVETAPGEFCARVTSQGSFETVGGDGPGCVNDSNCGMAVGRLGAGVVGTFQGGATMTFTGTFDPGNLRTKGSIGTFDHACDATTMAGCGGPGFTRWRDEYFTDVGGFTYDWWGWVYHAGNNGSWVNAASGNTGNITGD